MVSPKQYSLKENSLAAFFWKQKWCVLLVTVIYTLLIGVFIFNYKPIFNASVELSPCYNQNWPILNFVPFVDTLLDEQKLYDTYLKRLRSSTFQEFFFKKISLAFTYPNEKENIHSKIYLKYLKTLSIREDFKSNKRSFVTVGAESTDKAVKMLNAYLLFINDKTRDEIEKLLIKEKKIAIETISNQIALLTQIERLRTSSIKLIKINPMILKISMMATHLNYIYKQYYTYYSNQPVSLKNIRFYEDSQVIFTNTGLKFRFKITLILGVLGGLLLGLLISTTRLSYSSLAV